MTTSLRRRKTLRTKGWGEFVGEIGSPLVVCLARNDFEVRHSGANIIPQLHDVRTVPAAGEHCEPIAEQIGETAEQASSGADHQPVRARRQQQK